MLGQSVLLLHAVAWASTVLCKDLETQHYNIRLTFLTAHAHPHWHLARQSRCCRASRACRVSPARIRRRLRRCGQDGTAGRSCAGCARPALGGLRRGGLFRREREGAAGAALGGAHHVAVHASAVRVTTRVSTAKLSSAPGALLWQDERLRAARSFPDSRLVADGRRVPRGAWAGCTARPGHSDADRCVPALVLLPTLRACTGPRHCRGARAGRHENQEKHLSRSKNRESIQLISETDRVIGVLLKGSSLTGWAAGLGSWALALDCRSLPIVTHDLMLF